MAVNSFHAALLRVPQIFGLGLGRKAAKTSTVIATKALACKLAKAGWYLTAEEIDYDPKRVFPQLATPPMKP